ncbi:MAG: CsiV family protein [Pseudohongiella sp.]|nr:CsiV family protein [Pseudohongiella sp.]
MKSETRTFVSRVASAFAIAMVLLARPDFVLAQNAAQNASEERWYQIEVTVFAHSNAMREQEIWPMAMLQEPVARNTRPLDTMMSVYDLPDWNVLDDSPARAAELTDTLTLPGDVAIENDRLSGAPAQRTSSFRLPDPERDAFLALPSSAHLFQDTNRALRSDGRYRVMYHNAWRQPMRGSNQAIPVWLEGGNQFGARHELEGSLSFRFNPGQDRVVLNARLWLTQFAAQTLDDTQTIQLPDLPASVLSRRTPTLAPDDLQWSAVQVIPVLNTRELRSNEFHYLDHPAVGILVQIMPYTVPPLPEPEPELLPDVELDSDTSPAPSLAAPAASS